MICFICLAYCMYKHSACIFYVMKLDDWLYVVEQTGEMECKLKSSSGSVFKKCANLGPVL